MTTKQPGDRRNGTALPEIREGITIGHDVCDTHAEAARRADDLLQQTPAAICASIRREVRP